MLFYDAVTSGFLGGFNGSVNFGAGMNPGFYSLATFQNLDALAIDLGVTDNIVTQTITGFTGTGNRFGVASLDPVTVGASPTSMYIQASTVNGGTQALHLRERTCEPRLQGRRHRSDGRRRVRYWSGVKELFR